MKPGDPCPSADCDGRIRELKFSLTIDCFSGDAWCDKCGEGWCIAEEVVGDEEPCPTWKDHEWVRQQSGYFRCAKCPFEKTEAEIELMESQP